MGGGQFIWHNIFHCSGANVSCLEQCSVCVTGTQVLCEAVLLYAVARLVLALWAYLVDHSQKQRGRGQVMCLMGTPREVTSFYCFLSTWLDPYLFSPGQLDSLEVQLVGSITIEPVSPVQPPHSPLSPHQVPSGNLMAWLEGCRTMSGGGPTH